MCVSTCQEETKLYIIKANLNDDIKPVRFEALLVGLNIGLQRAISNLPDVVEISVGHAFQFLQLRHLIQHLMEVEL